MVTYYVCDHNLALHIYYYNCKDDIYVFRGIAQSKYWRSSVYLHSF
jgi:hypothetical protein